MYYSVSVDHKSMAAAYLTTSGCEGIRKCCIYSVMDGHEGDMLWNIRGVCEGDGGAECAGGESDSDW
jgi:hypothetical protein